MRYFQVVFDKKPVFYLTLSNLICHSSFSDHTNVVRSEVGSFYLTHPTALTSHPTTTTLSSFPVECYSKI